MMWRGTGPVTRNLIIINFLIYAVEIIFPGFCITMIDKLGLHVIGTYNFNPIQFLTYMFVHDNHTLLHILFNMFSLWMFGRILEATWGSKRYFMFYMVCGIGAAIVQEAVWLLTLRHEYISGIATLNNLSYSEMSQIFNEATANGDMRFMEALDSMKSQYVTIGASGAVFGLLLGFAMAYPNMPLYLFFIPVPIKAKYMMIGYAVLEFFLGVSGGGTIAHFAHLGGMLFGLFILLYWKKKGKLHGNGFY